MIDYSIIIDAFYPDETPLKQLLLKHSVQVRDKALAVADLPGCARYHLDRTVIEAGSMLHDIGIIRCNAPGILCVGTEPYIAHGILGGSMLREYGDAHGMNLEIFARICERHTGTGLSVAEITAQNLPLPHMDFCPETAEEKLICFADKFYSKSGNMLEKKPEKIRASLEKFGADTLERWDALVRMFFL